VHHDAIFTQVSEEQKQHRKLKTDEEEMQKKKSTVTAGLRECSSRKKKTQMLKKRVRNTLLSDCVLFSSRPKVHKKSEQERKEK
jgi:tetrahydrodipicolinate N-succinyltransferase